MNTFGHLFRVTTFGESHGAAIGAVIDGCPAGLKIDVKKINEELKRRKPGQSAITSSRQEDDEVEILSGIYNGISIGSPIALLIRNKDQRPADYEWLKNSFRPSHADFTYEKKYGLRDYRGGGRASARATASVVAAGAIAKQLLLHFKINLLGFVSSIGVLNADVDDIYFQKNQTSKKIKELKSKVEASMVRCLDQEASDEMIAYLKAIKADGDTCGGIITTLIYGLPVGIGEPIFGKLSSQLSAAMLSINAVHGFQFGSGFHGTMMQGSEHNDIFVADKKNISTKTNYSGGIQGGISNGMPLFFDVAFKPIATVMTAQPSINSANKKIDLKATGRHDPCAVPRAVPIVEAMAALTVADLLLQNRAAKI